MPETIRRKNVLITGAASGFGWETANLFAQNPGYRVIATDKNPLIHSRFPDRRSKNIITSELDVRDPTQIAEVISFVMGEYGSIDVLINNAGVMYSGDKNTWISDGQIAPEIIEMYQVNVNGPKLLMDQVLKNTRSDEERVIINITSSSMHNRTRVRTPYALSKTALIQLTHEYAEQFRDSDIRFVAVQPGLFKTNIDHGDKGWIKGGDKFDEAVIQRIYSIWRHFIGGDPKDVARVNYAIAENKDKFPNDSTVLVGWDSQFTTFMDKHFPFGQWNNFFEWSFDHGVTHLVTQALLGFAMIKIVLYLAGK